MMQLNSHFRQVELWVDQELNSRPQAEVIDAFNKAFQRVWDKAELTLGNVTMQAVADRIIHVGHEEYPWLSPLQKKTNGIDFTELAQSTSHIPDEELKAGLAYVLGEFLRILGSLTAEIISSKLHAALMEGSGEEPSNSEKTSKNKDSMSPVAKGGKK